MKKKSIIAIISAAVVVIAAVVIVIVATGGSETNDSTVSVPNETVRTDTASAANSALSEEMLEEVETIIQEAPQTAAPATPEIGTAGNPGFEPTSGTNLTPADYPSSDSNLTPEIEQQLINQGSNG